MWLYRITAAALGALCELSFLPFTATKLSRILKIESPLSWATIPESTSDLIVARTQINEAELLCQKVKTRIQKQIDKLEATKQLMYRKQK
jgi:methionyl-tRNA synthetase